MATACDLACTKRTHPGLWPERSVHVKRDARSKVRFLLALLLAVLPASVLADIVLVSVLERGASESLRFEFDTASATVSRSTLPTGEQLPAISDYFVREYQLVRVPTNATVGEAIELLGQVRVSGGDFVVVRQEYNSYSNPLYWLAAFSGHPVQVSRIAWFLVSNGGDVRSGSFLARASSYHWSVDVSTPKRSP